MIRSFSQAQDYLYSHIPKTELRKFPGDIGLLRMKLLMKALKDPQEKYQVVHIAGTSGKGSTAILTSTALRSQGYNVGLHLSPHILDIRERVQINNAYISQEKFVQYLNEIIPAVENTSQGKYGPVTYFEIIVALAYYAFGKEDVDVAVIETGMGGLLDGTNVVVNPAKIAVLTPIGFDHVAVLGNTLEEIAMQKAGIIHKENRVIVAPQTNEVNEVFVRHGDKVGADISQISTDDYEVVSVSRNGTEFVDHKRNVSVRLRLIGAHQAQNAMLASEVVYTYMAQQKKNVHGEKLLASLRDVTIPARFDIVSNGKNTMIIDGAHNEQKMKAFLTTLQSVYPNRKFLFLVSFKHGKDIDQMMKQIEEYASEIIITDFKLATQDMLNLSENPEEVATHVSKVPVMVVKGAKEALEFAKEKSDTIVVTGSLYFASEIYRHVPDA